MGTPTKIDQVVLGLKRLITQWQDKPVVVGLLKSYLEQVNTLEDVYFQLLEERGIYEAIGEQLDVIGALFGVSRLGRNDEDYRSAILLKVSQLKDDGTTEVFMQTLRTAGNTNLVNFWEHDSGDVHAYMGEGYTSKSYGVLENAVPAGVNLRLVVDNRGDSFIPTELIPQAGDLQVNDGIVISDLQVDDSVVVSDLQTQTAASLPDDRGKLPELVDVDGLNPLAELIIRDSFQFNDNLIYENSDLMIDENGFELLYTDYNFA